MTTNFTAILNANLDMLDGYDYPSDIYELANGDLVTIEEIYSEEMDDDGRDACGWYETEDGVAYEEYIDWNDAEGKWDYYVRRVNP